MPERNVEFTDGAVTIRPYLPTDVKALFEAVRDSIPHLSKWMPWCHDEYAIEESAEWVASQPKNWQDGDAYNFVILDAADGTFLGGCGIGDIRQGQSSANLGYWVRESAANRGVATAAARMLARFGFEQLRLKRIRIAAALRNGASRRVAAKLGARQEKIVKDSLPVRERKYDAVVFVLTARDLALAEPGQVQDT